MCELFGLSSNKAVRVNFSWRGFRKRGRIHRDGWGVAWLDDRGWHVYKEPIALYESRKAEELTKSVIRGRIIVSHVRLASVGISRKENTHPWLYRGWVFAHNGTIDRYGLLRLLRSEYKKDLEGNTDSEAFFHLIVQEVNDLNDPVEGIRRAVEKIVKNNIRFSSLNFIASSRERLYALRYARTRLDYYTLHYIERPREGLELRRLSRETRQLILMKLARGERAVIVASETMSNETYWRQVPNKHLVIVDKNLNIELKPVEI